MVPQFVIWNLWRRGTCCLHLPAPGRNFSKMSVHLFTDTWLLEKMQSQQGTYTSIVIETWCVNPSGKRSGNFLWWNHTFVIRSSNPIPRHLAGRNENLSSHTKWMNLKVITLSEKEVPVSKDRVLFHSNSTSFSGTQNRSVVGVRQGCNREEALVMMVVYRGCSHGSVRLVYGLRIHENPLGQKIIQLGPDF